AYLAGTGPLPVGLTEADHEHLKVFSELVRKGIQFVNPDALSGVRQYGNGQDQLGLETSGFPLPTLAPECAFLKLIAYRFHTPENQVQYATVNGNMLSMATLRPQYLKGLDFFLRESEQGQEFYRLSKSGYEKVELAWDFLGSYADDPEGALVLRKEGEVDVSSAIRALTGEDGESYFYVPFRDAGRRAGVAPDTPAVEVRGKQVVVGGVVLKRRR
ncbi:MAG: hypothetical protein AB1758_32980, partial [Candidatus Eremiobacterota bacterium]